MVIIDNEVGQSALFWVTNWKCCFDIFYEVAGSRGVVNVDFDWSVNCEVEYFEQGVLSAMRNLLYYVEFRQEK